MSLKCPIRPDVKTFDETRKAFQDTVCSITDVESRVTAIESAGASNAPASATYITQTPNATLTNEQALSALATGILKSTTVTGVVSIATAGTDYSAPGHTHTASEVTDFTEASQDVVGAMVDSSLEYVDATPLLRRAALTGDIAASAGSNLTAAQPALITGKTEDTTPDVTADFVLTHDASAGALKKVLLNKLGAPGGSTTQLQYNNAGAFGGISVFTFDGTTLLLTTSQKLNFRDSGIFIHSDADGSLIIESDTNATIRGNTLTTVGVAGDIKLGDSTERKIYPATDLKENLGDSTHRFNNAFIGGTLTISNGTVVSGTYTPTLTNTTNLAASTAYQCQYMRVGNVVSVSGKVDIDPTIAGSCVLGISLPIASNFGAVEDCGGTALASGIAGQGAAILGDATNNRATMQWIAVDVTNQAMYFHFQYEVI